MELKFKNNFLFLSFNLINIIIFYISYDNINSINYILFSIISLIAINYTLLHWRYYTELYLNIFLYLGFWFKFSINISQKINYQIAETNKVLSDIAVRNNYSDVLDVISLSVLTIFLSFFIAKKVNFSKSLSKIKLITLRYLIINKKVPFLKYCIITFLIIIFLNSYFDIAYIGQTKSIFLVEKIFKFLLIILLPLLIVLIFESYTKIYGFSLKSLGIIIICFFLISITLNSRALIINILPFIIYYYYNFKNLKKISLFLISIGFVFLISFEIIEQKRNSKVYNHYLEKKIFQKIIYLSQNRWVGISGMINVEYTKEKNLDTFKEALLDRDYRFNFYEKNFFYSQIKKNENYKSMEDYLKEHGSRKFKNVFTPGFMALFYFSGSIIIFTVLNVVLVFLLIFSEKICNYFVNCSKLFLSIFSLILVWRVIHLGLYPTNSLIFYFLLLFTPITFWVIDRKFQNYLNIKNDKS